MRQTRAAFISAGGDIFLVLLMFKLFQRWQDEVDKLYICFNGNTDQGLVEYVRQQVTQNEKVVWIYDPRELGYGMPIKLCLDQCQEDLILLLEDDGFIYNRGVVERCFRKIEEEGYDVVGSPRFSCSFEWSRLMKTKLGLTYKDQGDTGPNFWPNFFFCRRSDLLKTDLEFAPVNFPQGTYVPLLDYTAQEEGLVGDTFVWVSIQLRMMGLSVFEVPQYKASPLEHGEYMRKEGKWNDKIYGWIHGGSLSVFWSSMRIGKYMPDPPNEFCLQEYETRVAFWTIAVNLIQDDRIESTIKQCKDALEATIEHYKMDRTRLHKKILIYQSLLQL